MDEISKEINILTDKMEALERALRQESAVTGYEEIFQKKGFPRTGEVVRCRRSGALWRVMEREVWRRLEVDPITGEERIVPLFYFSLWRLQEGVPPRVGEMLGFLVHPETDNFAERWELPNDSRGRTKAGGPRLRLLPG